MFMCVRVHGVCAFCAGMFRTNQRTEDPAVTIIIEHRTFEYSNDSIFLFQISLFLPHSILISMSVSEIFMKITSMDSVALTHSFSLVDFFLFLFILLFSFSSAPLSGYF